ncbi:hypothetical protein [Halobaculum sp. EA56]|uniref:hypothetical protein n=1 Tax=Halobaculum sp. EA56 TaxID=3421648 RepID=UPI003EBF6E24
MAILKHPETGERKQIDGEIPFGATYGVEGYDEEQEEFWEQVRVDIDGESWIVVDDGTDMVSLGPDT